MKTLRLLLLSSFLFLAAITNSFSQDNPDAYIDLPADEYPAYVGEDVDIDTYISSPSSSSSNSTADIIETILGITLFTSILGHMIYIKYLRTPRYKTIYSTDFFITKRKETGANENMSSDEYDRCVSLFQNITSTWDTNVVDDESYYRPTKMKQIKVAVSALDEVIAIAPTDEEIVTEINEYIEVINDQEYRSFYGSKLLMWFAAAIAIIPVFFGSWVAFFPLMFGVALYYLACQKPMFLVEKKADGSPGIHNSIIANICSMALSGKTIRTTTTYTDGSKTVEDDSSGEWIMMIFGFALLILFSIMISLWSLFSYLRNYVIYR